MLESRRAGRPPLQPVARKGYLHGDLRAMTPLRGAIRNRRRMPHAGKHHVPPQAAATPPGTAIQFASNVPYFSNLSVRRRQSCHVLRTNHFFKVACQFNTTVNDGGVLAGTRMRTRVRVPSGAVSPVGTPG